MREFPETADGAVLGRWARACVAGLEAHRAEIDDLNVFPVPDGDTGTNLLATMRSAVRAVGTVDDGADAAAVASALARGAVTGARGNSGAILSQVLRGFARGIGESPAPGVLDGAALQTALQHARALAVEAVSVPMEGTIVTVLGAAARAAAARPAPLAEVARIAADTAADALARTPHQLHVLGAAGVVDAGGLGLVVILDALVETLTGVVPDRAPATPWRVGTAEESASAHPGRREHAEAHHDHAVAAQDYEVMYLVSDTDRDRIAALRARLGELGDSVVIVSDDGDGSNGSNGSDGGDGSADGAATWSVHVHCVDAGAAVEAGLAAGALSEVRITCFVLEAARTAPAPNSGPHAVLVVAEGEGAAELFEQEGVRVLRSDGGVGSAAAITPAALLDAIRGTGRREVLVLPNGALSAQDLVAVGARARADDRNVVFLPSSSTVQALAAVAVHDPARIAVDDAFAMSEAAAATRWGSLRIADERALTYVGTCEPGDGLGLVGHEVVVIEPDAEAAGRRLVDLVLRVGGELVTILLGAKATNELGERLAAHIDTHHPGVEVAVYQGGQGRDLLQFGVE